MSLRPNASEAKLASDLMLAPFVIAMRMPLMMAEAANMNPWRVETTRAMIEKSAALAEGLVASQVLLAQVFWGAAMGRKPASSGRLARKTVEAALRPAGKTVRKNYRRLSKPA